MMYLRCRFFSTYMSGWDLDYSYYLNVKNYQSIRENALIRQPQKWGKDEEKMNFPGIIEKSLVGSLPNQTHPKVRNFLEPLTIKSVPYRVEEEEEEKAPTSSSSLKSKFKKEDFERNNKMNCRNTQLGEFVGDRGYYLLGSWAQLETAITQFAIQKLRDKYGFQYISVPDILHPQVIKGCGMEVDGEHTMVYKLQDGNCLSGTAEMALGGFIANKSFDQEVKFCSSSRCYRAEISKLDRGIYRVHYFTKVEMFIVTSSDKSDQVLEDVVKIQQEIFDDLGLAYRVLDMSPDELGDPAYRKYDIEAYFPSRDTRYGEISSCSNCTDYQSRRLGVKLGQNYAHTVNGTAAAIPRLIMAMSEQLVDRKNGQIRIPECLREFMGNKTHCEPFKIPKTYFKNSPIFFTKNWNFKY